MAQPYKICPICGTPAHHNAVICTTCGATLSDVEAVGKNARQPAKKRTQQYDQRYGEADLYEGELSRRGEMLVFGGTLAITLTICGLLVVFLGSQLLTTPFADPSATPTVTSVPTQAIPAATPLPILLATNTARPPVDFATVTPAPPTETPLPPPTECVRVVQSGDTLFGIAFACGHRDAAVIDLIVEENGLASAESLQLGQEIRVPPPTPTTNPNPPTEAAQAIVDPNQPTLVVPTATFDPINPPTATLQPGVIWHVVRPDETMLSIALSYGANAEILSQLNPEVEFLQCDFEFDSGGPRCVVQLGIGQQIRVPAPTATPTIQPTASGSETPTPSATPTYNAPSAVSPGNRALFQSDELVTLRWAATGTLSGTQVYRVQVRDITAGIEYSADVRELFFIVPTDWQGTDQRRHEYQWSVSVVDPNQPDLLVFSTETREFIWESQPGS